MMTDPAYALFRADAQRQGFATLAGYFRHYGIVPPADWGRPAYKDRELAQHDALDRISAQPTWTEGFAIDKSWGESGRTYLVSASSNGGEVE